MPNWKQQQRTFMNNPPFRKVDDYSLDEETKTAFRQVDESFLGKMKYKWGRFKEELKETLRTGKSPATRMDENVASSIKYGRGSNNKNINTKVVEVAEQKGQKKKKKS